MQIATPGGAGDQGSLELSPEPSPQQENGEGGAKTLSGPALSYLSKAVVPHARLPPPNFAAALAQAGPHCCGLTTPHPRPRKWGTAVLASGLVTQRGQSRVSWN